MKKLIFALFTVTIIHVEGNIFQIIDTDNKIVCYVVGSDSKELKGAYPKGISCVAINSEPVKASTAK